MAESQKLPMVDVTLSDLNPRATVYGSYESIDTNYAAWNAKAHSLKQ